MITRWLPILAMSAAACGTPSSSPGDDAPGSVDAGAGADANPDAPPPVPTTITITLSEHAPTTAWFMVAYRDGNGAWQQLPDDGGDTFSFVASSGRWSFVWACEGELEYARDQVNLLSFTTAERTSYSAPESCPRYYYNTVPVHATLSNATVAYPDWSQLSYGTGLTYLDQMGNGSWEPGTHDAYLAQVHPVPGSMYSSSATRVAVKRGFTAGATGNNLSIDLATALATGPTFPVTIHLPTAQPGFDVYPASDTEMYDPSGTRVLLAAASIQSDGLTRGLAASQEVPGLVYEQHVQGAVCDHEKSTCDLDDVEHWSASIAAQERTPVFDFGAVTPVITGNSVRATFPAYPGAAGYTWNASQLQVGDIRWVGVIGKGYAGTTPSLEIPDLSQLTYGTIYPFSPAGRLLGGVSAIVTPLGASDVPPHYPAPAGTDRRIVTGHLFLPGT